MKKVAILGSTGSIGTQTLEIIRDNEDLQAVALAAGQNVDLMEKQIREFHPQIAGMWSEEAAADLRQRVSDLPVKIVCGMDGLLEIASFPESDVVVTAVVGMIGIRPTIAAIESGKTIALANKETLVTAGHIIMPLAAQRKVPILPVDSEHSAIFQSLQGRADNQIHRILLTASGGPFRGKKRADLEQMTLEDALKHPNWSMGAKITIDSASMMNKGFEVIEAKWLFGMKPEQIEVVVHPQSIVHSMVQFTDGCVKAQLGVPDMRLPIQYALTFPERTTADFGRLDFKVCHSLTFEQPDEKTFRNLGLAYEAMRQGGNMPCILNAANEVAVAAFLQGRLSFTGMSDLIEKTMQQVDFLKKPTLEDYMETDRLTREIARKNVSPKIPPL